MIELWNMRAWYEFLLRSVFVAGMFAIGLFASMQIWGWEITIQVPTIEHTFHKR